jgi:hypothetical protein
VPDRPTRIWRIEYEAALGWPEPEHRRKTYRHCFTAEAAGRQIATIRAMPSHLALDEVLVTSALIEWEPVDPATLPIPEIDDDYELGINLPDQTGAP